VDCSTSVLKPFFVVGLPMVRMKLQKMVLARFDLDWVRLKRGLLFSNYLYLRKLRLLTKNGRQSCHVRYVAMSTSEMSTSKMSTSKMSTSKMSTSKMSTSKMSTSKMSASKMLTKYP
jgi:hypothetical protein